MLADCVGLWFRESLFLSHPPNWARKRRLRWLKTFCRNRRHQTPLYVSCKHGHAKICKMLLKAGAEPNPRKPSRADVEAGITAFVSQTRPGRSFRFRCT